MRWRLALLAGFLALAGCATQPAHAPSTTAELQGDVARPAQAAGWVRSELYFGVGEEASAEAGSAADRPQAGPISQARWRDFLDGEVTPRFPDGLTVFDGYGQWRFKDAQEPNRLRTKVLVILHEDTPQRRADIDAIRLAWKRATGHESVLWAKEKVEVSF